MRTMCSREIFTKKCRQQQIFDSDLKGAWHYNHVTFTPIAKNFMLYCRLIYMLSILCVRLEIQVKVGIPESFKVGWYPPKKLGRVTLTPYSEVIYLFLFYLFNFFGGGVILTPKRSLQNSFSGVKKTPDTEELK